MIGVAKRIRAIRRNNGMTLEEFGKHILNANKSVVSKWERGIAVPNKERLKKIAEMGNISVEFLISGDSFDNLALEQQELLFQKSVTNDLPFGEFLRGLRKSRGLSIVQLSELSSVSNPYISQIENNKFIPSMDVLNKLAGPLGVDVIELGYKVGHLNLRKNVIEIPLNKNNQQEQQMENRQVLIDKFYQQEYPDILELLENKNVYFNKRLLDKKQRQIAINILNVLFEKLPVNYPTCEEIEAAYDREQKNIDVIRQKIKETATKR